MATARVTTARAARRRKMSPEAFAAAQFAEAPCMKYPTIFHNPLLGVSSMPAEDGGARRPLTPEERETSRNLAETAATLCRGCPLFDECLRNGAREVDTETRDTGVYAGLSPRQLRRFREKLGLPSPPAWSMQSAHDYGVDELVKHREAFDKAWDRIDYDDILAAWYSVLSVKPRVKEDPPKWTAEIAAKYAPAPPTVTRICGTTAAAKRREDPYQLALIAVHDEQPAAPLAAPQAA